MDWILVAIFALAAIVYIFVKRSGQISPQDAHAHLKNGALIVDVRTPAEFNTRHLPHAINLPSTRLNLRSRSACTIKISRSYSTATAACAAPWPGKSSMPSAT